MFISKDKTLGAVTPTAYVFSTSLYLEMTLLGNCIEVHVYRNVSTSSYKLDSSYKSSPVHRTLQ